MRTRYLTLLLIPLLGFLGSCETTHGAGEPNAEISAVLDQIKQALADIQTDLASKSLPPLKQVKLSLKTTVSGKAGASFKLLVITVGGTWEKDKVQQVEIVLTPPEPGNARQIATESITQVLEDAIISAAQGVQDANVGAIPLRFSSLVVTLEFTVKSGGTAGATPVLGPVAVNVSGNVSKTAVHTVTVTFGTPSAKEKQ